MTAPAPTRAEEAREAGQVAYEAWFADARPREMTPWAEQPNDAKSVWARVERAVEAYISSLEGIEWLRTKDIDRLHDAEARVAVLEAALTLCADELDWQINQTKHCGDPNYECPLQDIHKPSDSHAEARAAARAALQGGDHAGGGADAS